MPIAVIGFLAIAVLIALVPALQPTGHIVAVIAKRLMTVTLLAIGVSLTRKTLHQVGARRVHPRRRPGVSGRQHLARRNRRLGALTPRSCANTKHARNDDGHAKLTIDLVLRRMTGVFAGRQKSSARKADKSLERTSYGAVAERATRLARALVRYGIQRGDRVATLMWNHATHLEAYLGIPLAGAICHTLNLRLHCEDIAQIATDAGDRLLIVDDILLPLYEKVAVNAHFERVLVVGRDYEVFLASGAEVALPQLHENDGLGMCYTSGTTGKAQGRCLHPPIDSPTFARVRFTG